MTDSQTSRTVDPELEQAREHYRRLISPEVEAANLDRLVAFDTESEDLEIGDDLIEMVHRLKARRPNANIIGFRVGGGGRAVDRFGSPRSEVWS
jgi:hypothetical protein